MFLVILIESLRICLDLDFFYIGLSDPGNITGFFKRKNNCLFPRFTSGIPVGHRAMSGLNECKFIRLSPNKRTLAYNTKSAQFTVINKKINTNKSSLFVLDIFFSVFVNVYPDKCLTNAAILVFSWLLL